MTWTQLRYGMAVVAAGTAITGTLVWFGSRGTIEPIDVIEVWQAASERAMATQYTNAPANIVTNAFSQMYAGGADPSGISWVLDRTNGPQTNAYVSVTWSNAAAVFTNLPGSFRAPPPYFCWTFHENSTTQRVLWGAWSNLTVAGVTTATNYNGVYAWDRRSFGMATVSMSSVSSMGGYDLVVRTIVDVYSRSAGGFTYEIHDAGPVDQSPIRPVGPACYRVFQSDVIRAHSRIPGVRADGNVFTNAATTLLAGNWKNATVTPGAIMPDRVRDAWTYTAEVQRNPFVGMPWYSTQVLIADTLRAAATNYADDARATNGVFVGFTNLPLRTVTGTYAQARGVVTNLFPSEAPNYIVNTNDLAHKYAFAQALKWTTATDAKCSWSVPDTNAANWYLWETPDFGTYDEASNNLVTNAPNIVNVYTAAASPEAWIELFRTPGGTYQFRAQSLAACLTAVGLQTNFPITNATYYGRATADGTFDAMGYSNATDGVLVAFDEVTGSNTTGTSTSSVGYGTTNPPWLGGTFPADPGTNNLIRRRGWTATGKDIVLKWGFNYAKDALP